MASRVLLLVAILLLAIGSPRTSARVITEFPLPRAGSNPYGITAGPDGNLWFTDIGTWNAIGTIGQMTPAGVLTEFRPSLSNPKFIVNGPDVTSGSRRAPMITSRASAG